MTTTLQPPSLTARELRQLALDAGADDAGLVEVERAELDDQRADLLHFYPWAKSLLSFVVRMNREPLRSTARSVANLEFHSTGHDVDEVGRAVVRALEARGLRAVNPSMGFPMETERFPGKLWTVSHKPVAVAAGLGRMGIHRSVIHPKFGSFILLGTIVLGEEFDTYAEPVDFDPCLTCKLCVAACPVGAIRPDGYFDFSACYTHNYREFMGGYTDYVEQIAESKSAKDLRERVSDAESVSWWQSLSYGANYKAAYCLGVCPAGEEVIAPFEQDRAGFVKDVVKPLQEKSETLYVLEGSDAERYAHKRYPHKPTRTVGNSLRPSTIAGFLRGMAMVFQREAAEGLDATYHFTFTGEEPAEATIEIRDQQLTVRRGHSGEPDLRVTADSRSWIRFLRKERGILPLLLTRKVRLKGPAKLLVAFGRCFP
ncbi:MAG: SCP2 sterol-binding domain-containing protein [Planctomycetota bacterium]|jgi:NAD-dependent dihydropyrimidine dehydrogenase PreA subunit